MTNKRAIELYTEGMNLSKEDKNKLVRILNKVDPDGVSDYFWAEEVEDKLEFYKNI